MSITRMIEVGAATAKAAIQTAAESGGDSDAALMRVGVLEFLRAYAERLPRKGAPEPLLAAYQAWLDMAVRLFSEGDESLVDEYMNRVDALAAELDRALASADAPGDASPQSGGVAGGGHDQHEAGTVG